MPEQSFTAQVTAAARSIARTEVKLREARRRLAELEEQHRECKRQLRLLVQSTETYTPPTTAELASAIQRAAEPE